MNSSKSGGFSVLPNRKLSFAFGGGDADNMFLPPRSSPFRAPHPAQPRPVHYAKHEELVQLHQALHVPSLGQRTQYGVGLAPHASPPHHQPQPLGGSAGGLSPFRKQWEMFEQLKNVPSRVRDKDELDTLVRLKSEGVKFVKNMLEVPVPDKIPMPMEAVYSSKVFVGGLPPDCTNVHLYEAFAPFGQVEFVWPMNDKSGGRNNGGGYCFLIFASDASVNRLLANCRANCDGYFKQLNLSQNRQVQVQIRPWLLADGDYVPKPEAVVDPRLTVFVGGVPRTVRAFDIAHAMSQFGPVVYAGIDVDAEHSYPKGAARISFTSPRSYIHAMGSKIVTIVCKGETKTLQLKPYLLEEAECEECTGELPISKPGKYFCAEVSCLSYFCESCWQLVHFERHLVDRRNHPAYVRMGDQVKTVRVERAQAVRFDSHHHHHQR